MQPVSFGRPTSGVQKPRSSILRGTPITVILRVRHLRVATTLVPDIDYSHRAALVTNILEAGLWTMAPVSHRLCSAPSIRFACRRDRKGSPAAFHSFRPSLR